MRTVEERKIEKLNKIKTPVVIIDKSLNKYDNVILFPEKQAKYDELLRAAGHPEDALQRLIKSGKIRE